MKHLRRGRPASGTALIVGVLLLGPEGCLLPDLETLPAANGGKRATDATGGSGGDSLPGATGGSTGTPNGGRGGGFQGVAGVPIAGDGGTAAGATPGRGGSAAVGVTTGGVGSGGTSSGGGSVGGSAPGGAPTGGTSSGGTSAGGASSGGSSSTGGKSSTGGSSSTGGKSSTGGSSSTGGTTGSGGTSSGGAGGGPLGDLNALRNACLQTINDYRATVNPAPTPLMRASASVETCSDTGAASDAAAGTAHGSAAKCSGMSAQDTCPGWPPDQSTGVTGAMKNCLAQMWAEGEPPEGRTSCVQKYLMGDQACFLAHGHYLNMSDPSSRLVACGFAVMSNGRIWMNQDFGR